MPEVIDRVGPKTSPTTASRTAGYNPFDPLQQSFLSALAKGESPGGQAGLYLGVGGTDLSNAPTDQYGFPQWQGFGNSHAAGWFQFQPGTWDEVASRYDLNFRSPEDQKAGAWYYAQTVYRQKTGGDLTTALQKGDYSSVQTALAEAWPSVLGNGASPGGLVGALSGGTGANIDTRGVFSADTSPLAQLGNLPFMSPFGSPDFFVRLGLLVVGVVVILIALWHLLSQTGVVPSPAEAAKSVTKLGSTAAAVLV